jgi:hypothetical protein
VANDREDHASSQSRRRRALSERLAFLDCNTGSTIRGQRSFQSANHSNSVLQGNSRPWKKEKLRKSLQALNQRYGIWKARFWLLVKRLFQSGRFPHLHSLAGRRNLLEDLNLDRIKFDTRICSTDHLPIRTVMPRHNLGPPGPKPTHPLKVREGIPPFSNVQFSLCTLPSLRLC